MRPKIGGKSAYTLRGNLQHDRRDEKEESGAQLSGQRAGVHPRQIFNAAVCANLITDRPDDVITAENDEVENKGQQQRVDLVRLYVDDLGEDAFHVNDEARMSNDKGITKPEE